MKHHHVTTAFAFLVFALAPAVWLWNLLNAIPAEYWLSLPGASIEDQTSVPLLLLLYGSIYVHHHWRHRK